MASGKSVVSLPDLLSKLFGHEFKRRFDFETDAVKRAATQALAKEDWPNVPIPLGEFGATFADDPDPNHAALARAFADHVRQLYEQVARGDLRPVELNDDRRTFGLPDEPQWDLLKERLAAARAEIQAQRRRPGDDNPTLWQFVVKEIVKSAQIGGLSEPVLWEFARQVKGDLIEQSGAVTAEIARLDASGFTSKLVGRIDDQYPDEAAESGLRPTPMAAFASPEDFLNRVSAALVQIGKVYDELVEADRSKRSGTYSNDTIASMVCGAKEQFDKARELVAALELIGSRGLPVMFTGHHSLQLALLSEFSRYSTALAEVSQVLHEWLDQWSVGDVAEHLAAPLKALRKAVGKLRHKHEQSPPPVSPEETAKLLEHMRRQELKDQLPIVPPLTDLLTTAELASLVNVTAKRLVNAINDARKNETTDSQPPHPVVAGLGSKPDTYSYSQIWPWLIQQWPGRAAVLSKSFDEARQFLCDNRPA